MINPFEMCKLRKESESPVNTEYPRYIQDKPKGVDRFYGGSQNSLARAIAGHIRRNDSLEDGESLPRIIGIEGTWGSGKSNVVKLVEKKLEEDFKGEYYFFEYDAWGNQEDLQRRSFLEQLTAELVKKEILAGKTAINETGGDGSKKVSWNEKLKYLLSKKRKSSSFSVPHLGPGIIAAFVAALLTPSSALIGTWTDLKWPEYIRTIIAFLPCIIAFLSWLFLAIFIDKRYWNPSLFFAIFNDKVNSETSYETISEDEPSVCEFKDWMETVSKSLNSKVCKKLVVVFDNMDRLPSEKVKQLWSSIHTFFAETGFPNIWVIIPYDREHLSCAFGKESDKTKNFTKCFIDKTFPVTFDVAKPVISDYKQLFTSFYKDAFGETHNDEEETINRLYRLNRPEANVREIIIFINRMVSLCNSRNGDVRLVSMALFQIFKDEILKNPVNQILSGEFLGLCSNVVNYDDLMKAEISALVYGVELVHAKQIPLQEYIRNCIDQNPGYDINTYAESDSNFITILSEVCHQTDSAKLSFVISMLDKLKKSDTKIEKLWGYLASQIEKEPVKGVELSEAYCTLLKHVQISTKKRLAIRLCHSWASTADFDSEKYICCVNKLKDIIHGEFELKLEEKKVSPSVFSNAVSVAQKRWREYRLTIDANEYEAYLIQLLPDRYEHSDIVLTLKETAFSQFGILKSKVQEYIKAQTKVTPENVRDLLLTQRYLSSKEGQKCDGLSPDKANTCMTKLFSLGRIQMNDGYIDLIAIRLAQRNDVIFDEEEQVSAVAAVIGYYIDISDLILKWIDLNSSAIVRIVQYIIQERLDDKLDVYKLLPKYDKIKQHYNISDEDLLEYLKSYEYVLDEDSLSIFEQKVQISFFDASKSIKNPFTAQVNTCAVKALNLYVDVDKLKNTAGQWNTNYWHRLIWYLLDDESMTNRPKCLVEFASAILEDFTNAHRSIPLNEYTKQIIESVECEDKSKVFCNLRNHYCNNSQGSKMTSDDFLLIENGLRESGELEQRPDEVLNFIIKPVVRNEECKKLIKQNCGFYKKLIIQANNKDSLLDALKTAGWTEEEIGMIIETTR